MRDWKLQIYKETVEVLDKLLVNRRKKLLNNDDFSIICNNCWAGYVYRRFGIPYRTPTVGLYFFASDFVKLCSDVKGYMQKPLEFIPYTESRYRAEIEAINQTAVPLARLGDVEVVFLHYKTREEAEEKWKRRAERINYDNLIYKFSNMNRCKDSDLTAFDAFDFPKKICLASPSVAARLKCGVPYKSARTGNGNLTNDTMEYARWIDLVGLINSKRVCGTYMEGSWNDR